MTDTHNIVRLIIPTQYFYLRILHFSITTVVEELAHHGHITDPELLAGDVYLAAHETCTNIIDHAYAMEGNGFIFASIVTNLEERTLEIMLEDTGRAYDPTKQGWPPPESWHTLSDCHGVHYLLGTVPEPDIEQVRGRGLHLLTQLVETVTYRPGPERNCWHLVKRF